MRAVVKMHKAFLFRECHRTRPMLGQLAVVVPNMLSFTIRLLAAFCSKTSPEQALSAMLQMNLWNSL